MKQSIGLITQGCFKLIVFESSCCIIIFLQLLFLTCCFTYKQNEKLTTVNIQFISVQNIIRSCRFIRSIILYSQRMAQGTD